MWAGTCLASWGPAAAARPPCLTCWLAGWEEACSTKVLRFACCAANLILQRAAINPWLPRVSRLCRHSFWRALCMRVSCRYMCTYSFTLAPRGTHSSQWMVTESCKTRLDCACMHVPPGKQDYLPAPPWHHGLTQPCHTAPAPKRACVSLAALTSTGCANGLRSGVQGKSW
jgi:hypothetical protein